jgi:hypothetical protein
MAPSFEEADPPSGPEARTDFEFNVSTERLFQPEADPTQQFPHQDVELVGYVAAPRRVFTVGICSKLPDGPNLLDELWSSLKRRGIGRRRIVLLDERGRMITVLSVQLDVADEMIEQLESMLVVPVRIRNGSARVHLRGTTTDLSRLHRAMTSGTLDSARYAGRARDPGVLDPREWAFLGLLSSVGAFEGAEGPSPELVADLLGIDRPTFVALARAVERGLSHIVKDLFAPSAGAAVREDGAARTHTGGIAGT